MTGRKQIKVCGMTEGENIRAVEALGVDLIGFIFYPRSPRFARSVPSYLPERAGRVGVFVDSGYDEIMLLRDEFGLEYAQLHGAEPPEFCERLRRAGLRVIKAFGIGPAGDGLPAADSGYAEACDLYLFDTRSAGYGGSGRPFEWDALRHYSERVPFFLSGGVGPDSVVSIEHIENDMFVGVDLNSRFELSPGVKDVASLAAFIESITYRNTLDNK